MQRLLFATPHDLIPVLEAVEAKFAIQYTLTGLFPEPPSGSVSRGAALPSLFAYAPGDSNVQNMTYLVTLDGTAVAVRPVPQRRGGILYAVDQLMNPDSISITPSAWYSSDVLFEGRIATASKSAVSKQLYGAFARPIGRRFRRVNAYWLGAEAEAAWHRGARLTSGILTPKEYDLRDLSPLSAGDL